MDQMTPTCNGTIICLERICHAENYDTKILATANSSPSNFDLLIDHRFAKTAPFFQQNFKANSSKETLWFAALLAQLKGHVLDRPSNASGVKPRKYP